MTTSQLPRSVWVTVLVVALCCFGWRMNTLPLTNWDEGIYANVNLELFRSHDWTKLTYFGADFLEKPPLQFWLTFPLIGMFGPTEFALRLWSVLAGIGTALLVSLWAWQASGKRAAALIAGIVLVLGRFSLIHAFRTGDVDGLMTFCIVLAMYGYWRSPGAPRWMVVWGAASAAAVMTKSVAGLVPVIVVGFDMLLTRGWRKIGWGNIVWGLASFLLLVTPWHIIETIRFGQSFWNSYLGLHVIERTTESLFTKTPWYWYLGIIRDRFFPFSFFLPLTLVFALKTWWHDRQALLRLCAIWALVVLAAFTMIQTRREWYILPLYPALALLVGLTVTTWWQSQSRWLFGLVVVSVAGAFAHLLTDHHFIALLIHVPGVRTLTSGWWISPLGRYLFGVVCAMLIFLLAALFRRWSMTTRQWILGLTGVSLVVLAVGWSIQYIRSQPTQLALKTISQRIAREQPLQIDLAGTRLKKEPAGYFYILRLDAHSAELPAGQIPRTPLYVTTNEAKNEPMNMEGKTLVQQGKYLLIDVR